MELRDYLATTKAFTMHTTDEREGARPL